MIPAPPRQLLSASSSLFMTDTSSEPVADVGPDGRWPFLRDVLVLQLKLLIGNVHNFILMPATLAAAALDITFKSVGHGTRFYRVLDWGRRADEAIGLYSALDREERPLKDELSIDALVTRLEEAVVREYERGSTAAAVKSVVDRILDQVHSATKRDSHS